jgi:predicted RNA binding protein YcfA (HicA-like mRNA interferase family)
VVTGRQAVAALLRGGFISRRQRSSHHMLTDATGQRTIAISVHGNKPLPVGTLRDLIHDAGLTVEEFIALL